MRDDLRRRRPWTVLVVVVAAASVVASCGDAAETGTDEPPVPPEPTTSGAVPTAPTEQGGPTALVAVRIEQLDGILVEGFEVGLRIEDGDGQLVESTTWSDVVAAQGAATPRSAYDTVWEQAVPVGSVVVGAQVEVGTGSPPSVPDLTGDLPCRVELDLDEGERADLEVRFGAPDCLVQVSTTR